MSRASNPRPAGYRLLLAAAAIVATAAGVVGLTMIIAPGSTGTYFAWPLGPPALAALVGGFYLVSAPVFGYAGRLGPAEVRGLAAAVLAFTIPTIVATYLHRDAFDFGRPAAIAWVILFVASPITFAGLLWVGRRSRPPAGDGRVPVAVRFLFGAVAVALAALAGTFWVAVDGPVPFDVGPLGARFLAAWLAFLAVLAAWPAVRPTWTEVRLPLLALVVYPVGGLIAGVAHLDALGPGAVGYLAVLAALAVVPTVVWIRTPRRGAVTNGAGRRVGWRRFAD